MVILEGLRLAWEMHFDDIICIYDLLNVVTYSHHAGGC